MRMEIIRKAGFCIGDETDRVPEQPGDIGK
jgi:hypothetical protein